MGSSGAFSNDGRAWIEGPQLAPDEVFAGGAQFGASIALSADGLTAVIAAPGDRLGQSVPFAGSVYVFTRPAGSQAWTKQARLTHPASASWRRFGTSVAIAHDGATIAVGQVGETFAGVVQDSAWIFTRTGTQWSAATELMPAVNDESEQLGLSIALSGDGALAVVGAPGLLQANHTATYVFAKVGGVWGQQQKITYVPANGVNYFGAAVAVAGNQILVGDPFNDEDVPGADQTNAGAVMAYALNAGTWQLVQTIRPAGSNLFAAFGSSIAVRGEAACVGAPTAGNNVGKAYRLRRVDDHWSIEIAVDPPSGSVALGEAPQYGRSVAIASEPEAFIVGAPADTVNGVALTGRAYFPGFVTEAATFTIEPTIDPGQTTFSISFLLPSGRFISLSFEVIGQLFGTLWRDCDQDESPSALELTGFTLTPTAKEAVVPLTPRVNLTFTNMRATMKSAGGSFLIGTDGSAVASGVEATFAADLRIGPSRPIPVSWVLPLPDVTVHVDPSLGGLALSVSQTNGTMIADLGLRERNPTATWSGSMIARAGATLPCDADLDQDGAVGASDLALVLGEWGQPKSFADLDFSGDVDASDLAIILGAWGTCP
jgi:hypothetical protein